MRLRRRTPGTHSDEFLRANAAFRRYVLRELERRGPLLSREIEDHHTMRREDHDWWGARKMGLMLEILAARGEVAVVGRRGGQRVWDLAERWYPETETIRWPTAERLLEEQRFRALGVRLDAAAAGSSTPTPPTGRSRDHDVPVAVRPADPRPHADRGALRLLLPARDVRAEGEARVRLLRAADPPRRPARRPDRARVRQARACPPRRGLWWEDGAEPVSLDEPLAELGRFLGAERVEGPVRSADGVRDARDPRRPGARPGHRGDHHADLPDVDVRPGGGRRAQGLRLLARREPDPDGARDGARVASSRPRTGSPSRPGSARRRR